MNEREVHDFVEKSIPEFYSHPVGDHAGRDITSLMQSLYLFTNKHIVADDYRTVKKALQLVENLYRRGDQEIRTAIDTVFIFLYTRFLQEEKEKKDMLLNITPVSVYRLYINQVINNAVNQ
ncbi:MAG: hypothetical protein H0X33_10025 [Taibaiella sp.]|nr:hypothetical protein [Taibaiella sp.]